ncbi:hypothetical protein [Streptomyces tsukubensis]|uniref:LPXTG cell wall anchor domain-containing protein n=1 Tax=Streptomyces tsukubensis TaxID=83656 RepID=A0A1V4A0R3_9ACTN|nr:hypothetical protein [Streptomyces tsukubensis]OON72187.1 hypothetical protein B1H18_30805 [Streptomyces tsukubensis]QFR97078.1 hypothetical protein GBW32_33480 [Streptomyces tsukubensis]
MRTSRLSVHLGTTAVALALTAAPPWAASAADGGIHVTTERSIVQVTTTACEDGGRASLMARGAGFDEGYRVELTPGGSSRTGSWMSIDDGVYTVEVRCDGGRTAGRASVTVDRSVSPSPAPSASSPAPSTSRTTSTAPSTVSALPSPGGSVSAPSSAVPPAPPATARPAASPPVHGVKGGLGGGTEEWSPSALVAGSSMVVLAGLTGAWLLRRRKRGGVGRM